MEIDVRDHDYRPSAGQLLAQRLADARSPAGDDGNFVLKKCHRQRARYSSYEAKGQRIIAGAGATFAMRRKTPRHPTARARHWRRNDGLT